MKISWYIVLNKINSINTTYPQEIYALVLEHLTTDNDNFKSIPSTLNLKIHVMGNLLFAWMQLRVFTAQIYDFFSLNNSIN